MGILLFVSFFILLLLGTPIALAIGIPSFLVINLGGLGTPVIAPNFFAGIAKFPLLAIPLFILAGFVLEREGSQKFNQLLQGGIVPNSSSRSTVVQGIHMRAWVPAITEPGCMCQ